MGDMTSAFRLSAENLHRTCHFEERGVGGRMAQVKLSSDLINPFKSRCNYALLICNSDYFPKRH
jgi:hypothetical protein